MNKLLTAIAVGTCLSFGVAHAASTATAQQSKMATCNKDAGDKKGAERKAFMKECLGAKPAAAATTAAATTATTTTAAATTATGKTLTPQQQKMKTCNADAKTKALKGAERKAFMKTCLSNKPA
jgi:hypothetical protein